MDIWNIRTRGRASGMFYRGPQIDVERHQRAAVERGDEIEEIGPMVIDKEVEPQRA